MVLIYFLDLVGIELLRITLDTLVELREVLLYFEPLHILQLEYIIQVFLVVAYFQEERFKYFHWRQRELVVRLLIAIHIWSVLQCLLLVLLRILVDEVKQLELTNNFTLEQLYLLVLFVGASSQQVPGKSLISSADCFLNPRIIFKVLTKHLASYVTNVLY